MNPYVDEILDFLDKGFDSSTIHKRLNANEKMIVSIGTLRSRCENCGVIPHALFIKDVDGNFDNCDWPKEASYTTNSKLILKLKINFSKSCTIIPCGEVSYPLH